MEPTDNSVYKLPRPTKPKRDRTYLDIMGEWNKYMKKDVKKKYYDYEVRDGVKHAKCNRFRVAGDGRRVQCDACYRNPSCNARRIYHFYMNKTVFQHIVIFHQSELTFWRASSAARTKKSALAI
jgi:hypothetical protein